MPAADELLCGLGNIPPATIVEADVENEPLVVSRALARLGAAYRDAGRQPQARTTLQQALTNLGPAPQGDAAAIALQIETDLAYLAQDKGDVTQAEAAYKAARDLLAASDAGQDPKAWAFLLAAQRDFLITQGRL